MIWRQRSIHPKSHAAKFGMDETMLHLRMDEIVISSYYYYIHQPSMREGPMAQTESFGHQSKTGMAQQAKTTGNGKLRRNRTQGSTQGVPA